jgi:hypothetical protein
VLASFNTRLLPTEVTVLNTFTGVTSRLDPSPYDSLVINFPASVNRKHIERAMTSQFDHHGTVLLNALGRSSTYTIFGDEARSVRVSGLRDTIRSP